MPAAGAGALTVIVPVAAAQSAGEVALAVGAAGAVGGASTVTPVKAETQPAAFFTVTL